MRIGLRIALSFLILLPLAGAAICFVGYQHIHAPIKSYAGFGQTPAQCAAAYGPPNIASTDPKLGSPKTLGYVRGGLSITVGFDETDHAEQFIFAKATLLKKEPLSEAEQKNLLSAFSGGGDWVLIGDPGVGPVWRKADGDWASYIKDSGWLVFMNNRGMERMIRTQNSL